MQLTTIYTKLKDPEFWLTLYACNSVTMIGGKIALLLAVISQPNPLMVYAIAPTLFNNSLWNIYCILGKKWLKLALNLPVFLIETLSILYLIKTIFLN